MFYNFVQPFLHINILRYITFRSMCAVLTSLALSFILYPIFINKFHCYQPIRVDGPQSHIQTKQKTPTMGGAVLIFCVIISSLLWGDITNSYLLLTLFIMLAYSILGFVDDYKKIKYNNSNGISEKQKMIIQVIFALIFSYAVELLRAPDIAGRLTVPFFKNFSINSSLFLICFTSFVIVGSSNAVNLTDGLDGLVTMPALLAALCFGIIAYVVSHIIFANYLQIMYIQNAGEVCIVCASIIGACLGFLWYNAHPAMIFMGDTGSLAIGGALGAISVITKHEFILAIIGGVFVLEAISVLLQVISFKLTGKRIFKMAPIHHHFEQKGWKETKVVVRFWIISFVLALIGLATLKIR